MTNWPWLEKGRFANGMICAILDTELYGVQGRMIHEQVVDGG
jgi:hypothetical protein